KAVAAMRNLSLDLKQDPETGQVIEGGEAGVIPDDDSTFWKYLTRYKDVCHLWASHWVLSRNHAFYRIPEVLRDGGQLETFLAHAAWFLELGESHTTRNDRGGPWVERATAFVPSVAVPPTAPELGSLPDHLIRSLLN